MKNLAVRCFLVLAAVGGFVAPLVTSCSNSGTQAGGTGGAMPGTGGSAQTGMGGDCGLSACMPASTYDCSNAVTPNALVTDFGGCTYNPSMGRWGLCPLTGLLYAYKGDSANLPDGSAPSTASSSVDYSTGHNYIFNATVSSGGYAGAGLQFQSCADVSSFTGIQFTLAGTSDCDLELQLSTFSQRPTTQSPPGGCDSSAGSCYNFPSAKMLMKSTDGSPITVKVNFADASNWDPANAKELVGLQWQATSPAAQDGGTEQPSCNVALLIDDIMFTTN